MFESRRYTRFLRKGLRVIAGVGHGAKAVFHLILIDWQERDRGRLEEELEAIDVAIKVAEKESNSFRERVRDAAIKRLPLLQERRKVMLEKAHKQTEREP
jgi:hypothetical protein